MHYRRWFTKVFLFALFIICFVSSSYAQVQGDQMKLFSTQVTLDVHSASARTAHNDPTFPSNWLSPVDWTTGPVYWKVHVASKKTNEPFQLELHFEREHPDGTVGSEEIAEPAHRINISNTGDTIYMKLDPLSTWSLYSTWITSWQWTKPINGIYIILYAMDDSKNNWVWFADNTVCAGYDFCYKGALKQTDHLPITIDTDAYVVKNGGTFQPPSTWAGCPFPECANIPTGGPNPTNDPQPTTNPSAVPTILPTSQPGQCINKNIGDANCDDTVGLTDFEIWRREFLGDLTIKTADFNGDGKVNLTDYEIWRRGFLSRS